MWIHSVTGFNLWLDSSSAVVTSEAGEVHEKVAEDARMSYSLKPRHEPDEEENKLYVSYITDFKFVITELLDLLLAYTVRAKKVRPKLVYLQEIVLS